MTLPPPLPPQGFLLESLGYLKEPIAAIALDSDAADPDRIPQSRDRAGLHRGRPHHLVQPR